MDQLVIATQVYREPTRPRDLKEVFKQLIERVKSLKSYLQLSKKYK